MPDSGRTPPHGVVIFKLAACHLLTEWPSYIGAMASLNRRSFLAFAGAAGLSAALRVPVVGQPNGAANATGITDFTFLFITDTHLEPELDAAKGCDQCFKKARTIKSDFA